MRFCHVTWGRIIVSLVIVLAFLQVLHIALLSRLEAKYDHILKVKKDSVKVDQKGVQMREHMRNAVLTSHVLDSSGEYQIVKNFVDNTDHDTHSHILSSSHREKFGVTLVTQCSLNNLHHLINLHLHWGGQISVTVFTPGNHLILAAEILLKMFLCHPGLWSRITVHLAYPLSHIRHQVPPHNTAVENIGCNSLHDFMDSSLKNSAKNYGTVGIQYPVNLLRNVALQNARTEYVFVIDIDIQPSQNLHKQFIESIKRLTHEYSSLKNSFDKTVYVVPVFEMKEGKQIPHSKSDLILSLNRNEIRPFYFEMCWECQKVTDYDTWRNLTITDDLRIGYELKWKDPWEPFFIAKKNMVAYDERFKQYGFNRISQVCELHIAGYKFAVLNNVFLVHDGFKTKDVFHSTKEDELIRNRQLFRQFKEELKTKYPDSKNRCY